MDSFKIPMHSDIQAHRYPVTHPDCLSDMKTYIQIKKTETSRRTEVQTDTNTDKPTSRQTTHPYRHRDIHTTDIGHTGIKTDIHTKRQT